MQEESPKRRLWPSQTQVVVEIALLVTVLLAYGAVAYLNFNKGQVRGPFAISRYHQLGDFKQFAPVAGEFDLNRNLQNFDVQRLTESTGKIVPDTEKEITVPPIPADK